MLPVHRDGVVDRRDHREAVGLQLHDPGAQHLVVVGDVEVAGALLHQPRDARAEGLRLGEPGRAHGEELLDVDPVAELAQLRHPERVGLAVEVEARHLGEHDALVEVGVGLAGEHLHLVARAGPARG